MITTQHLLILGALALAWSGGLAACVELAKRAVRAIGWDHASWWVRGLPLLGPVLGVLTGALGALPVILSLAGVRVDPSLPLHAVGAFLGVGAGAVSGQAFKTWRQSIRAVDRRLKEST